MKQKCSLRKKAASKSTMAVKTFKKTLTVLMIVLLTPVLFGCKNTDDVKLTYFNMTLGDMRSALTENTQENLPKFKVIRDELDSYIYKCAVSDHCSLIVYRASNVNAVDIILEYPIASDDEFTTYAKTLGTVIVLISPEDDIDEIISALSLDDFTSGTQNTFSGKTCSYEYNVYDDRLIFSMYISK